MLKKVTSSTKPYGPRTRSRVRPTAPHPTSFSRTVRKQLFRATQGEYFLATANPFAHVELLRVIAAYSASLRAYHQHTLADRVAALRIQLHNTVDLVVLDNLAAIDPVRYPWTLQISPGAGMTTGIFTPENFAHKDEVNRIFTHVRTSHATTK